MIRMPADNMGANLTSCSPPLSLACCVALAPQPLSSVEMSLGEYPFMNTQTQGFLLESNKIPGAMCVAALPARRPPIELEALGVMGSQDPLRLSHVNLP